jgi:N-acetylglutamate synthase-like GNAT family acetyltransferase
LPQFAKERAAHSEDAEALVPLFAQLGYPTGRDEIRRRLEEMGNETKVLVATADGDVVGFVVVIVRHDFVGERSGEIQGLVVAEEYRSEGIGAGLLAAAERVVFECGMPSVRIRSNVVRERAHRFYERHGYARVKTQHIFEKRRQ